MSKPRILLIGAGSMGSLHARVISQSPLVELATVIDPRKDVGGALADRFGATWAPAFSSLAGVDGVVVAAATEAHFELAMEVIEAGIPLLVEKPMSDGLEKTMAILDRAETLNVPIMCGLLERFNPAVVTAKALLDSPLYVTATRHSPYVPRIRTGVSWDLLVHDIDLAIGILGGTPTLVTGTLSQFHPSSISGAEDVAEVVLGFESGGTAHISASRIGQRKIRTLSIHELDRMVEVDLLRRDVTVYHHVSGQADDDGRGYKQQTVIEIPELLTSQEPLAAQLDHFTALIAGTVDADAERNSIIPSHRVVDKLKNGRPVGPPVLRP
ncbi:Gfo/Idh/MocA family protein [Cryobacterium ruanii]|uniref:Gfo/Idh/MocA family oxidoreductase n=1 Tax=Cryobacterium ruanii TaxID=1259197 RepID=A0A4V6QII1_9MICO|nr:Gfo/Idh/MocA family oxidoreductase [Cryobacterium ruanii]TFD67294.1 Gfo/Idh/MocA family oxidoreductase [Cryobacterium ruanii]